MTDFALALENYLPEQSKHTIKTDIFVVRNPHQFEEALQSLSENGEIHCRTITGSECANTKCVGFCWNELHRGYLTKKQMDQHHCLEKNCHRFQKIETAMYWSQQAVKAQSRKSGKQLKKQMTNDAEEFLEKIRELTVHDFNFYPVAVELKNNTYEVRVINFKSFSYSDYLALFAPVANSRRIHFVKIKTDDERKQLIIDKHNIIKIALPEEPVIAEPLTNTEDSKKITVSDFVISKIKCIMKYIRSLSSYIFNKYLSDQ